MHNIYPCDLIKICKFFTKLKSTKKICKNPPEETLVETKDDLVTSLFRDIYIVYTLSKIYIKRLHIDYLVKIRIPKFL